MRVDTIEQFACLPTGRSDTRDDLGRLVVGRRFVRLCERAIGGRQPEDLRPGQREVAHVGADECIRRTLDEFGVGRRGP